MTPTTTFSGPDKSTIPRARQSSVQSDGKRAPRFGEYDHYEPLFYEFASIPEYSARHEQVRDQLIAVHTPVAEHIARRYQNRGEPRQDLVQVAMIGLINAVNRYQPGYGHGFLAYAVPTIRGEVLRHFRDATWGMRVPRKFKELQHELVTATALLTERLERSPRPSELAEHLGLRTADVAEALVASAAYRPESLNRPVKQEGETAERGEFIGEIDDTYDNVEDAALLRPAMQSLPERERRIVFLRFFRHMTQRQIADAVGLSQMHVSRLLARSLDQMRRQLGARASGPVV